MWRESGLALHELSAGVSDMTSVRASSSRLRLRETFFNGILTFIFLGRMAALTTTVSLKP